MKIHMTQPLFLVLLGTLASACNALLPELKVESDGGESDTDTETDTNTATDTDTVTDTDTDTDTETDTDTGSEADTSTAIVPDSDTAIDTGITTDTEAPPDCLIAHWPFSGNALDISSNNNDGVVTGATLTNDRNADPNGAYLFDGASDVVTVSHSASLNPGANVSVAAWVYTNDVPGSDYIVRKQVTGNHPGYTLRSSGGTWIFSVGTGGKFARDPDTITARKWYFLVGVYDGSAISLYVNGIKVNSISWTGIPGSNSEDLTIGGGSSYYFDGIVDDVKIYNCPLSQKAVNALYAE